MSWKIPEDDKKYITKDGLMQLLEQGAVPRELNAEQIGGTYSHVVEDRNGNVYVHNSHEEIDFSGIDIAEKKEERSYCMRLLQL